MTTPNLSLSELAASQSQPHLTVNASLRVLDALVQLSVLSRVTTSPPGSPSDGDRYIVPSGATGAWVGHDDDVALYQATAWVFLQPQEGWLAWVVDDQEFVNYTSLSSPMGWSVMATGGGGGAVATDVIWAAKGDLAVGTGDDTASALTVGTNGYVLTADSGQATGVKWASPTAAGWTEVVNNALTSLTGFVQDSGSWSVASGSYVEVIADASQDRLRYDTPVQQARTVTEVEIFMPSTSGSAAQQMAGILLGWDGADSGSMFCGYWWTSEAPTHIEIEQDAILAITKQPATGHTQDAWHTLKVVRAGDAVDVYSDGTFIASGSAVPSHVGGIYIGLCALNGTFRFRNFKHYTETTV